MWGLGALEARVFLFFKILVRLVKRFFQNESMILWKDFEYLNRRSLVSAP